MPKKTIYDIRGVLTHISEARTGTTRKEEPYAARTLFLDPQGGEFKTRNGNLMPNNKLRVWKIASLNQNGRVTAKKHQQPQDESDDEQDVPF